VFSSCDIFAAFHAYSNINVRDVWNGFFKFYSGLVLRKTEGSVWFQFGFDKNVGSVSL